MTYSPCTKHYTHSLSNAEEEIRRNKHKLNTKDDSIDELDTFNYKRRKSKQKRGSSTRNKAGRQRNIVTEKDETEDPERNGEKTVTT
jgi:hypothetical protein